MSVHAGCIVFRHPLERAAAVGNFDERTVRGFHQDLSALATGDLQRVASHLAAATEGPDDAVATVLVNAAQATAASEAVDLYERAAALWSDPDDAAISLIRGAESAALGGSALRAQRLVERGAMAATRPGTTLRCSHLRGRLALSGVLPLPEGRRELADALEIAVGIDPDRAVRICLDAVLLSVVVGDRSGAVAIATRGAALARSDQRAAGTVEVADVVLAGALAFDGRHVDEVALTEGCARLIVEGPLSPEVVTATVVAMNGLIASECYRSAATVGSRFVHEARERGSAGAIPLVLALTGKSELYLDDIESAVVRLNEAEQLASETHQAFAATYALLWSGVAAAQQGDRTGVQRAAQEFSAQVAAIGNSSVGNSIISYAFGHLALSEGKTVEAAGHFDDVARFRLAQGAASDGMLRWEGDYVEVLMDSGRIADAQEQLDRLERRLEENGEPVGDRRGGACPGAPGARRRADAAFRLAVDTTGGGFAFARYRTQLCWGERLSAAGRPADAVAHLQVAATGFEGVGARAWAARARQALAGARSGDPGSGTAPARNSELPVVPNRGSEPPLPRRGCWSCSGTSWCEAPDQMSDRSAMRAG